MPRPARIYLGLGFVQLLLQPLIQPRCARRFLLRRIQRRVDLRLSSARAASGRFGHLLAACPTAPWPPVPSPVDAIWRARSSITEATREARTRQQMYSTAKMIAPTHHLRRRQGLPKSS